MCHIYIIRLKFLARIALPPHCYRQHPNSIASMVNTRKKARTTAITLIPIPFGSGEEPAVRLSKKKNPFNLTTLLAALENGEEFFCSDHTGHFRENAIPKPQPGFNCNLLSPVIGIDNIEKMQRFLQCNIAPSSLSNDVASLMGLHFATNVITYARDRKSGEPAVNMTSVNILSTENYTRFSALSPYTASASSLPLLEKTKQNVDMMGFVHGWISEFVVDIGMSKPGSAYNVRVQYADRIDWHADMNTKVNTQSGIHMRAAMVFGANGKVSFRALRRTHDMESDDDYAEVVEGVSAELNTTSAFFDLTSVWSHGGIQLCHLNPERTEGIQMVHRLHQVEGDRVVVMIDWIVDSVEKARAAMMNVKNNGMINMSDELSKQYHEFLEKYGLKL